MPGEYMFNIGQCLGPRFAYLFGARHLLACLQRRARHTPSWDLGHQDSLDIL
jgi:hypothetical protein